MVGGYGRCSLGGHGYYNDGKNWRYIDNKEIVNAASERPCKKCGHMPTSDGDDYCIANLPGVMNACCGHGTAEGYVQFTNGVIIRGKFTIEGSEE